MVNCAAVGCTNYHGKKLSDGEKVTFHRFPSNPELRSKWVEAVNRPWWKPENYSNAFLCSQHFKKESMDRTSLSVIRLRDNAVPEIFPDIKIYRNSRKLQSSYSPRKKKKVLFKGKTEIKKDVEMDINEEVENVGEFVDDCTAGGTVRGKVAEEDFLICIQFDFEPSLSEPVAQRLKNSTEIKMRTVEVRTSPAECSSSFSEQSKMTENSHEDTNESDDIEVVTASGFPEINGNSLTRKVHPISASEVIHNTSESDLTLTKRLCTNRCARGESPLPEPKDEVELFFKSFAMSIKKLSPKLIDEAKKKSLLLLHELNKLDSPQGSY